MGRKHLLINRVVLVPAFAALALAAPAAGAAPPTWPSAYRIWIDEFEGSGIDGEMWEDYGNGMISVEAAAAHPPGGGGLAVDVTGSEQAYLQRYNLTEWPHHEFPRDTYFRFDFNPDGVVIPAGETVTILKLRDGDWNVMAGLRLLQEGAAYTVVLELPDGSIDTVPLTLAAGWHTVVLGVRMHDWAGVWVDGDQQRVVTGVQHAADFVQVLILGKADGNWSGPTPSGTVHFDDVELLFAAYSDLWVDAAAGDDAAEGTTGDAQLKTIGAAANLVSAGTTVHIAPGGYRESVTVPVDGTADRPVRFVATQGRGTVWLLGSNPAFSVAWTRLTDAGEIDLPGGVDLASATIWKADLSAWGLDGPPRFVMARGSDDSLTRLPWAREPDWQVVTDWKHHEFWWAAEGGSDVTTCDPAAEPDCDFPQRSGDQLIDLSSDAAPAGVEPGSLASLGDVTGAIIFVKDNWSGHYTYRRRVVETVEPGVVRLEKLPEGYTDGCWFDHDPANPALGWNSKYFLEGLARFMDTPGEWYFDEATGAIYIWTPDGSSPDALGVEISARDTGMDLSHRSYVELTDLSIQLFEEEDVRISNSSDVPDKSHGITLSGLDIGWSTRGLYLGQAPGSGSAGDSQIRRLTLSDSRVHDMESLAIFTWAGRREEVVRAGITDFLVVHNEFDQIGFRDNEQGAVGMSFHLADHMLFEGNHVHDIAHNGVHFSQALTGTDRGYDLAPEEIITGDILVQGNLFEDCVQNAGDAGGLKFWGATADHSDTFRDVLVYNNVSRNNVGWTWVAEQRHNWMVNGKGGMGYYIDFAGGIHFFRNIAYENGLAGFMASGSWTDQAVVLANNTIVNSPYGYDIGTRGAYTDTTVGLDIVNTIFLNNRRFAVVLGESQIMGENVTIDYNLYHLNGWEDWPQHTPGIIAGHVVSDSYEEYPTLADAQAIGLEAAGREGDPMLAGFDPSISDGTWQDFRLTAQSALAVDTGTALPASLTALLAKFSIDPDQKGVALDRGAIEFDPDNPGAPYVIDVGPRGEDGPVTPPWDADYPEGMTPDGQADAGADGEGDEPGEGGCGCSVIE